MKPFLVSPRLKCSLVGLRRCALDLFSVADPRPRRPSARVLRRATSRQFLRAASWSIFEARKVSLSRVPRGRVCPRASVNHWGAARPGLLLWVLADARTNRLRCTGSTAQSRYSPAPDAVIQLTSATSPLTPPPPYIQSTALQNRKTAACANQIDFRSHGPGHRVRRSWLLESLRTRRARTIVCGSAL